MYDVILPFLLVFTIVYAMLERSKILGTRGTAEGDTRKNLNAMVAFTTGFFVVASSKIVEAIARVSSQIIVLLLLGIFFIMSVGYFYSKEDWQKHELGWPKHAFIIIMFVSLIAIFLNAIEYNPGYSWLEYIIDYITRYWNSAGVAAIILIIGIIIFMWYITKEKEGSPPARTT